MMRGLVRLVPIAMAMLVTSIASAEPHSDYMLHCQGCHGPAGAGVPGNVPNFRGSVGRFLGVDGGREYLVRVPGTSQSELSDERTAELLNWLVREFDAEHVPSSFVPYTAAEVARVRRPALTDVGKIRDQLIKRIVD